MKLKLNKKKHLHDKSGVSAVGSQVTIEILHSFLFWVQIYLILPALQLLL